MSDEPTLQVRAEQPYVGVRETVTMATIARVADRIGQTIGWLAARGVEPAGAPFLRYHRFDGDEMDLEAGVPVLQATETEGDLRTGTLPAGRYATVGHHGHPEGLRAATAALLAWAEGQGLRFDRSTGADGEHWGCRLEVYLSDPREKPDPADWDTDLMFRLAD